MDTADLKIKKCRACEGKDRALATGEVADYLRAVPAWTVAQDGKTITRKFVTKNFSAAVRGIEQIEKIAENEGHHPDLHLTGYRNLEVDLSTHSVGGLTENDFILAAKIDGVPIELKS